MLKPPLFPANLTLVSPRCGCENLGPLPLQQLPAGPRGLRIARQPGRGKPQLQRRSFAPGSELSEPAEALSFQQPHLEHREARVLFPEASDSLPLQKHSSGPFFCPRAAAVGHRSVSRNIAYNRCAKFSDW